MTKPKTFKPVGITPEIKHVGDNLHLEVTIIRLYTGGRGNPQRMVRTNRIAFKDKREFGKYIADLQQLLMELYNNDTTIKRFE